MEKIRIDEPVLNTFYKKSTPDFVHFSGLHRSVFCRYTFRYQKILFSAGVLPAVLSMHKEVIMNELIAFWKEEDGVAVVEIVLILVVLIALVLLFKDQITSVLKTILQKVETQSNKV